MLKTGRVNHVALKVTDVDKSREFYEKVVGLKKIPRPKINIPGEWYQLGENALHLIGGARRNGIDPTGPHIAVQVDSIDETKRVLNEMGVEFLDAEVMMARMNLSEEQRKMVGKQVWVADPDGNVLELQERPRAHAEQMRGRAEERTAARRRPLLRPRNVKRGGDCGGGTPPTAPTAPEGLRHRGRTD